MELKFDVDVDGCKICKKELKKIQKFIESFGYQEEPNFYEIFHKSQKKICFTPDVNCNNIITNWHVTFEE